MGEQTDQLTNEAKNVTSSLWQVKCCKNTSIREQNNSHTNSRLLTTPNCNE